MLNVQLLRSYENFPFHANWQRCVFEFVIPFACIWLTQRWACRGEPGVAELWYPVFSAAAEPSRGRGITAGLFRVGSRQEPSWQRWAAAAGRAWHGCCFCGRVRLESLHLQGSLWCPAYYSICMSGVYIDGILIVCLDKISASYTMDSHFSLPPYVFTWGFKAFFLSCWLVSAAIFGFNRYCLL